MTALAVAIALVAACGGAPRPVTPGQRAIGSITLTGAASVDDDDLRDGLGLVHAREEGQPFARFLVAQDRIRIQGYYLRRGFLAVDVQPEVVRRGERSDVTFAIAEGARATLARVEITGLTADAGVGADELRALIPLADGDVFDYDAYELAKPALPVRLNDAGYARAKVEGAVLADRERAKVVIRLDVDLGPLSRFGTVKLVGVPRGLGPAVRHRVQFHPGDRYSAKALEDTRAQLYEMGRFSLVRVEVDHGAGDELAADRDRASATEVANVTVTVAEAARHDLRLGGGVGLDPHELEVRGRALYSVAGWPWPSTTARLELRPAVAIDGDQNVAPRIDATAAIDRLDFVRPRYTGAAEASYTYLAVEAYTSYGPRLRLSARTPTILDALQVSVGWQLGLTSYTDLSSAIDPALEARLGLKGIERVGSFDQSLVVDLRDDKVVTRGGGYFEIHAEEGTTAAGGDGSFVRVVPDLRGYVSAGKLTLAARVRAGIAVGDVPATRRFFGGGAGGYRGLPGRQLSPFATSADGTVRVPYGGTALIDLSTELRVPITTWRDLGIGTVVFLDGGDVTEGWGELDGCRLHWALGTGLRVTTIVGAIRADLAYRLTRSGSGEPRVGDDLAFHLGIGEAF